MGPKVRYVLSSQHIYWKIVINLIEIIDENPIYITEITSSKLDILKFDNAQKRKPLICDMKVFRYEWRSLRNF